MIRDLGIIEPGTTLYIPFHTFDSNDPSASVTLTGLATTDIECYKDGSVTQRASDSGYALLDTDGIDFDATTGIHGISINLADNTTAGFWSAGSQYWVVIASVTVDAATVNFILCTFRIGYQHAILNTTIATLASQTSFTLTAGPAEDDALNGMWCLIHDVASAVQIGYAIISDYTGSTKTVTLAAGTTFTAAATDNISVMGPMPIQPTVAARTLDVSATGEAGIDWANIGSPTTAQNLSATNIDVDQVVASVSGAVGSVTGAVGSVAAGGITASSIATGAIDADALATDAGTEIASAVWDRDATLSQTQGTFGQAIGDPAADADSIWSLANTNLDATISSRASSAALAIIQADTDDMQSRLPAALIGGRMDSSIGAVAADTITASAIAADALSEIVTGVLTTQMTESYAADGVAPTLAQSLFQILGREYEFVIAGDTLTVRRLDGTTTAMTFTLAPAGGPYTSITRAT